MKHVRLYWIVVLILILRSIPLSSQVVTYSNHPEKVVVSTDRTLYVAGEEVRFSACLFSADDENDSELSKVLYCELITFDGKKVAGDKYPVSNRFTSGMLSIPEETVSGIYFLRFYTRFMRSGTPEGYCYTLLKVINPGKTEVLPGNTGISVTGSVIPAGNETGAGWSIELAKGNSQFSPRETVLVEINWISPLQPQRHTTVAVVPDNTNENYQLPDFLGSDTVKSEFWYPETRGLSLSGRIIEKGSGNTIPGLKVNLSIVGDKDILVSRSDSAGRFIFPLPPYSGGMDIFLSADEKEGMIPEILIDNDFCPKPPNLSSPLFHLSDNEMKAAYTLMVNARISSFFRIQENSQERTDSAVELPFYGFPRQVIPIDKYIELPSLQEYFTELSLSVKLRKSGGKKQFRFISNQPEMAMFDPLLLVDWVAVNEIEKVLSISPLALDRIELVNSTYIKGNTLYGGIVSFVSKKNNFAGIDLPASGKFINYKFFTETVEKPLPSAFSPNQPDARNTLYWNPSLELGDNNSTRISFPSPDTPGEYIILLHTIHSDGTQTVARQKFTVVVR